jgi:hypothetical protein
MRVFLFMQHPASVMGEFIAGHANHSPRYSSLTCKWWAHSVEAKYVQIMVLLVNELAASFTDRNRLATDELLVP